MLADVAPLRQRERQDVPKGEADVVQHQLVQKRPGQRFGEAGSGDVVELMIDVLEVELIRELSHDVVDPFCQGLVGGCRRRAMHRAIEHSSDSDEASSDAGIGEFSGSECTQSAERVLKPLLEIVDLSRLQAAKRRLSES